MKIKGLYKKREFWYFQPSSKGLKHQPKPIALKTKDFDEALQKVIDLRGVNFQTSDRGLKDWVEIFLNQAEHGNHYAIATFKSMVLHLKKMCDHYGNNITPSSIDKTMAVSWYNELVQDVTKSTAHAYMRYARVFFNWLIDNDQKINNPFARMKIPSPTQTRRDEFLNAEERDHLIKTCENSSLKYKNEMLFTLHCGFFLGMRIKEIMNAKWKWFIVRGKNGHCKVVNEIQTPELEGKAFTLKNKKEKMIPMNQRFMEFFQTLTPGKAEEYVIRPELGPRVNQNKGHRVSSRGSWNRLVKEAGFPNFTRHGMRHTFGSLHAMAGTPEIKIRRWMGITQETLERHYTGLSEVDPDANRI